MAGEDVFTAHLQDGIISFWSSDVTEPGFLLMSNSEYRLTWHSVFRTFLLQCTFILFKMVSKVSSFFWCECVIYIVRLLGSSFIFKNIVFSQFQQNVQNMQSNLKRGWSLVLLKSLTKAIHECIQQANHYQVPWCGNTTRRAFSLASFLLPQTDLYKSMSAGDPPLRRFKTKQTNKN